MFIVLVGLHMIDQILGMCIVLVGVHKTGNKLKKPSESAMHQIQTVGLLETTFSLAHCSINLLSWQLCLAGCCREQSDCGAAKR